MQIWVKTLEKWKLFHYGEDFSNVLFFELAYKLLAFFIGWPIVSMLFNYAGQQTGLNFLTIETLQLMAKNPIALLILATLLLWLGIFITIEVSGIMTLLYYNRYGWELNLKIFLQEIYKDMRRIVHPKNLPMILWIVTLFPLMGANSSFIGRINIPSFVLLGIGEKMVYIIVFLVLFIFLVYLYYGHIFIYVAFFYEDLPFLQAFKRSREIIKGQLLKTFAFFLLVQGVVTFLRYGASALLYDLLARTGTIFKQVGPTLEIFVSITKTLASALPVLSNIIGVTLHFLLMTYLYDRYAAQKGLFIHQQSRENDLPRDKFSLKNLPLYRIGVSVLLILLFAFYSFTTFLNMDPQGNVQYKSAMVISHRGGGFDGAENTIPSIRKAILDGADYTEIDVRLTKDQVVVLSHDANVKRTTGMDAEVNQLTLSEVKKLNAAAYLKNGKFTPVPTLEEVLAATKDKIKLNIEIKAKDDEVDALSEKVVELIKKHRIENQCLVTSINLRAVQKVKSLNSKLKTGYILPVSKGNIFDIPDVDVFCLEESFVSSSLVAQAHLRHKEIYVWTVNNDVAMDRFYRYGVDGIISDQPSLAILRRSFYNSKAPIHLFAEKMYDVNLRGNWKMNKTADGLKSAVGYQASK